MRERLLGKMMLHLMIIQQIFKLKKETGDVFIAFTKQFISIKILKVL